MNSYVPLHLHSVYSIRDAIARIEDIVVKAKECGMPAVALTDHGTVAGMIDFYLACQKHDVKCIPGCEVYVATRSRIDKKKGIDKYYHLVLLAMNNKGWSNLTRLVSYGYEPDNHYHKPRIDRELLKKYNEGLICLSACWAGHLPQSVIRGSKLNIEFDEDMNNEEKIEVSEHPDGCNCLECNPSTFYETPDEVIKWHKDVFGDRYYIEIQNHNTEMEEELNKELVRLAKKHKVKIVATTDSHFVDEADKKAHDILLAIRGNFSISDEKMAKYSYPGDGYHIHTYEEMLKRFPNYKEAINETVNIANRCNFSFNLGDFKLPHVIKPEEEDKVFKDRVMLGVKKRFGENVSDEIVERISTEINTITRMCFASYFIIVADFIKEAKERGIFISPGRGSAVGSLTSYVLGITNVNPMEHGLSFARFLNGGRASVPMIDFPEYPYNQWKERIEKEKKV